jgi:hypothetical protein
MATPPKKANARAGVRMRKSFDDKCTLTTVVNFPREFKGSPAMFASRLRISGLEPIRVSSLRFADRSGRRRSRIDPFGRLTPLADSMLNGRQARSMVGADRRARDDGSMCDG